MASQQTQAFRYDHLQRGCHHLLSPVELQNHREFSPVNQHWANFGGFGDLGVRGFKTLRFLLQKARPCVNPRRLSHFASKSVEGDKNPESHRAAHRKDMSPLTQGLNYRSACDSTPNTRAHTHTHTHTHTHSHTLTNTRRK